MGDSTDQQETALYKPKGWTNQFHYSSDYLDNGDGNVPLLNLKSGKWENQLINRKLCYIGLKVELIILHYSNDQLEKRDANVFKTILNNGKPENQRINR